MFVSDRVVGKDDARAQVWALPPRGEAFALTDEPHGVSDFKAAGTTLVVMCELLNRLPLAARGYGYRLAHAQIRRSAAQYPRSHPTPRIGDGAILRTMDA